MSIRAVARTEQLVNRLCHAPDLFDHAASDVQLVETHVSWVLLVGTHAYKIKKPLKLPFLDFSTLAQRRTACEEELRINRRTAPDLYLDVLPITGTPEAPRVGGDTDDAIEWAVHMRRFPSGSLLANLAARGELGPAHVDSLAAEVAAFQGEVAVAAPTSPYGHATAMARLAADNFPPIHALLAGNDLGRTLQQLERWTFAESRRLAPLMQARRKSGSVREGHGDLHLGNLLWLDGRARLFDAIEFDPQLRWIDTACDIGFAFMDLHAHGLAPLAWRFVNTWLEHSGDFDALLLLPFDAVYRALVRAKIAALRAAQARTDQDRAQAFGEVGRYVQLAARLAAPRQPWLALTMGVSGSGKSSQTQPLIEQYGMVRLRADVERKRLFGLEPDASSASVPGGIYSEATSDRLFAHLLETARKLLQAGQPVLVDATFIRRQRRRPFIELAEALGRPWRILAFDAPEDILRQRVRSRHAAGNDASEADEDVLSSQLARREPLGGDEATHALELHTLSPVHWHDWAHALPPAPC